MYMKRILFIACLLTLPGIAAAHTRWFTDGDLAPLQTNEPTALYLGVWGIIMSLIVATGIYLHQHNYMRLGFLRPKAAHAYDRAASTFTMIAGSFFLIAGTHEYLFSPNLTAEAGIPLYLIVIQIAIGLAFMVGIGTRLSAIVLGFLWASVFYYSGWLVAIENTWVLSTAIFIAIMGNDYFSLIGFSALKKWLIPFRSYALSVLRIGTGITLVILGLSEKLFAPEFGINFLSLHSWNFLQTIGLNFSDYLFVLSAGSVEIIFGMIFLLGIVTRLNALVAAIFFTTPLFILGPIELAGHLPHFAAIILLLLFGNGGKFVLFKTYKDARVK